MEKMTSAHITPIRPLPRDSAPLSEIHTEKTRGGEEIHSMGGGFIKPPEDQIPLTKKKY